MGARSYVFRWRDFKFFINTLDNIPISVYNINIAKQGGKSYEKIQLIKNYEKSMGN